MSDKDRELETLRNEVPILYVPNETFILKSHFLLSVMLVCFSVMCLQIAVLKGENAVAKTLQSAVETLEKDKAQLQGRVHSLEQRLMGTPGSEGGDKEAPPTGQEMTLMMMMMVLFL